MERDGEKERGREILGEREMEKEIWGDIMIEICKERDVDREI